MKKKQRIIIGSVLGGVAIIVLLVIAVQQLVIMPLTSFEEHRNKMCLRTDIEVEDAALRYWPGMDAALTCRFTVAAADIAAVFNSARVDAAEFNQPNYDPWVGADWVGDDWITSQPLTGGEVSIGQDVMRVGYIDNGDGTLTVHIFWFEV